MKDIDDLTWSLYLVRGGCAIHIGRYRGMSEPNLLKTSTRGMRDFTARSSNARSSMCRRHGNGCALLTTYKFNGKRYVGSKPKRR